jgi:uncharacterized protein YdhG (YjbR/CyaY superfamily)
MTVIDEFMKDIASPQRQMLNHIRAVIKQLVSEGEDTISYGIPVIKYKGTYVIGFATYKHHLSIFPGAQPIELLKDELAGYVTSKGTIQFTIDKPIPDELLQKIVTLCLDIAQKR